MPRPAPRVAPATTATRPRRSGVGTGEGFATRTVSAVRAVFSGSSADRGILAEVTPLQRYIAEEIATDHVDGLMSRREALRRMALIGVGATAAGALITACGGNSDESSAPES